MSTGISAEHIELLKRKVKYLASSLRIIQTEVEMKLGTSDQTEDLMQLADEINTVAQWIGDAYADYSSINSLVKYLVSLSRFT